MRACRACGVSTCQSESSLVSITFCMQHVVSIPIIQHNLHTINKMFETVDRTLRNWKRKKMYMSSIKKLVPENFNSHMDVTCSLGTSHWSSSGLLSTLPSGLLDSHMDVTCSLGSNKELNNYSSVHGVSIIHHLRKGNKTSYEDGLVRVANIFKR